MSKNKNETSAKARSEQAKSARERARANQKKKSSPLNMYWIIGGAIAIALIAVTISIISSDTGVNPELVTKYESIPAERNVLGSPDATVTLQVWEDFLWPACQQWARDVKPTLIEKYVETDQIKLEYKYLPLPQFEPEASIAAQSAECAADQGSFWAFHDQLFDVTSAQGRGGLRIESILDYAEGLGMDRGDFSSCLSGSTHVSTIQASKDEAATLGVSSTPTLLINGVQVENAFDVDAVTAEIDRLLAGL